MRTTITTIMTTRLPTKTSNKHAEYKTLTMAGPDPATRKLSVGEGMTAAEAVH